MTIAIIHHRNACQGGDPVESDRLRPLFLAWCGAHRTSTKALADAGIDSRHGLAWIGGRRILRNDYQATLRRLLDEAGIARSPCA
jgi:hypothetical protein